MISFDERVGMTPQQASVLVESMDKLRYNGLMSRINTSWKLYPIIKAYSQGKKIQVLQPTGKWDDIPEPDFTTVGEYRVKPEPKYRPFTAEELIKLIGSAVELDTSFSHGFGTITRVIIDAMVKSPTVFCEWSECNGTFVCTESLLRDFKFADGTPCGVEIKE